MWGSGHRSATSWAGRWRAGRFLMTVARLRPDVSLVGAQVEMDVITRRLAAEYPDDNTGWGVRVVSVHETVVGDVRPALLALLGAVSFVLLIACGNVANLLLARATSRERESAIRAAIGAGRGRLIRQFLTESLLLSAIGGALGVLLAWWGVRALVALQPADMPRLDQVGVDVMVCAFTVGVSLLTTVVFGLLPALQGARVSPSQSLHAGGRTMAGDGRRRHRLRGVLVVAEVALALMLLIGGGLMVRSFTRLLAVDPGFDPSNVLSMSVFLGPPTYRAVSDQKAYVTRALKRLERLPGVEAAAAVTQVPMVDSSSNVSFQIEGRPVPLGDAPGTAYRAVSERYFDAMGIPIRRGRHVRATDVADARLVIVINETMARRFWGDDDPVGQRIRWAREDNDQGWLTIVGVAGNVKSGGLDAEERPAVYAPFRQREFPWLRWTSFVVRSGPDDLFASDQGWLTIVGVAGNVKSGGLDAEERPAVYAPFRNCSPSIPPSRSTG